MLVKLRRAKYFLIFAIAISLAITFKSPSLSAERIDFNYSLLGFKIQVEDLATFANTGEISDSLNFYLKRIPSKQTKKLRQFLRQSYDVDPILVYRYSRTNPGIKLLQRIGDIIQLPRNLNGFYGLRAAVVQSAGSEDGVNLVDFLQRFPTNIRLNLSELLKLVGRISDADTETEDFITSLNTESIVSKAFLTSTPDFSRPGQFQVTTKTLELYDKKRERTLNTDLYLPQTADQSVPVVIVSNGLGAKKNRFRQLAKHLSSYGFAVAIPDHPGSDRRRQKAFVRGLYKENFASTEYLDRPLDISYILDQLERLNQNQLNNSLNLSGVGIFGYSIGGTTALSLAGADIDFGHLQQECANPLDLLNISTLYQCRALELPRAKHSLKDRRIKAAFMFVPFGNALFSQAELNKVSIPMMWQVVDQDFLTSLLTEQVPLFDGLINSDRHMVVSEKIPHSNVTLSKDQQSAKNKVFQIAKSYQNTLSLVFFQNYIAKKQEHKQYLSQKYLNHIAQKPYNLHLINKLPGKNIRSDDSSSTIKEQ